MAVSPAQEELERSKCTALVGLQLFSGRFGLVLRNGEQLHVGRPVAAAFEERDDVVHLVARWHVVVAVLTKEVLLGRFASVNFRVPGGVVKLADFVVGSAVIVGAGVAAKLGM